MSKQPTGRVYWDACIFIEWLNEGSDKPEIRNGILKDVHAISRGDLTLITSTITETEILRSKSWSEAQEKALMGMFDRSNVHWAVASESICRRARAFRMKHSGVSTPDAIHISTAKEHGVDRMMTIDGLSGRKRKSKKVSERLLLSLSDDVKHLYGFEIKSPALLDELPL